MMHTAPGWVARLSFERFAAALFFVAIGAAACLMPAQNDTWWQLRAGQEIVQLGSVPLRDAFSFTRAGEYWPNHEWLAQVVLYALYRTGGLPLVTLAAAIVVTVAWLIAWQLTPGTTWRRLALSALALPVFVSQWSLRPQVFTLLFLALALWLLVTRREALLPLLFVPWANMHGGVVLGVAVVLGVTAARVLRAGTLLIRPVVAAAGCVLATAATPLGFSLWTEVPASLARLRLYGVTEWQSAGITDPSLTPYWLILAGIVGLAAIERPWRWSEDAPFVMAFAALALAPVSLSASRNAPPFLLVGIPATGALLFSRFPPGAPRTRREQPVVNAVVLAGAAAAAVATVGYAWSAPAARLQWRPMSDGAIAAVAGCPAPLYNRYDDGGYLIWFVPQQKVFIDSRQDPYPPALVMEHIRLERSGRFEQTFSRYAIGCAFTPRGSLLARRLIEARWRRLYEDDRWVVLARPAGSGAVDRGHQAVDGRAHRGLQTALPPLPDHHADQGVGLHPAATLAIDHHRGPDG
jgi:hypothetical protein